MGGRGGAERLYSLLDGFVIGLDWNLMIRRVCHLKKRNEGEIFFAGRE